MRPTGVVVVAAMCLCLAATAAGQLNFSKRTTVKVTGCVQLEPQPASPSGRPLLVVTNASLSPDTTFAGGSTVVLDGGEKDLSKYVGKRVEIRGAIAQVAQRTPAPIGTSGSIGTSGARNPADSQSWPRALVNQIHSIGNCKK
jgi:hypothetical protein